MKVTLIYLTFLLLALKLNAQETITDIDGNVYNTVQIGKQLWLKENLKTTRYNNGDLIGTTVPDTLDISEESQPKYQWAYQGNERYVEVYGRLYTWYTITDDRKVCPKGYHVPTNTEWKVLFDFLGGGELAANKLKEKGVEHWDAPNANANNQSGFTALPAGSRWLNGQFTQLGWAGHYWSGEQHEPGIAYRILLRYDDNIEKQFGASYAKNAWPVRCIHD